MDKRRNRDPVPRLLVEYPQKQLTTRKLAHKNTLPIMIYSNYEGLRISKETRKEGNQEIFF
jgi:hypothetical protein